MDIMDVRVSELEKISDMTEAMLDNARQGLWEEVDLLTQKRFVLLEALFSKTRPARETPVIEAAMRQLMQVDQELIELSAHDQTEIGRQLALLHQQKQGVEAYWVNA
ncbi:MAG: hypothetical protein FD130_1825 [Halothiobacillaceae bacterium]|nr:MAG: hypothetical protein FD130_1825 [Halothiobacillaceae bacterium]